MFVVVLKSGSRSELFVGPFQHRSSAIRWNAENGSRGTIRMLVDPNDRETVLEWL